MAQGATQFCRRDLFFVLNGYDETLFMGEDVDFHWRLKRIAKRENGGVVFIEDPRVVSSTRRFDQWRLWRTVVWTNPLFILLFRRRKTCWHCRLKLRLYRPPRTTKNWQGCIKKIKVTALLLT